MKTTSLFIIHVYYDVDHSQRFVRCAFKEHEYIQDLYYLCLSKAGVTSEDSGDPSLLPHTK